MTGDDILRAFLRAAILVARAGARSPRARRIRKLRAASKWSHR